MSAAKTLPTPTMDHEMSLLGEQMKLQLGRIREKFSHAGNKGSAAEDSVRGFLRTYLPRSFEVGHGEVIDSHGGRSAQTDVVIATPDHPLTFEPMGSGFFFIEGIAAAGEVKVTLTTENLRAAVMSAIRFKALQSTPYEGLFYGPSGSNNDRQWQPRYFLFAFESQVTLDSVRTVAQDLSAEQGAPEGISIDAIFILGKGSLVDIRDGEGFLRCTLPDGTPGSRWTIMPGTNVLLWFMVWLSMDMPRRQSVVPILTHYAVLTEQEAKSIAQGTAVS